jgi:hypothetical protein
LLPSMNFWQRIDWDRENKDKGKRKYHCEF